MVKFKYIAIVCILFINTLFAIENTPFSMAKLAKDAYLSPKKFKHKYKTPYNKVGGVKYHGVQFYAIEENRDIYIAFRGTASLHNAKVDLTYKATQFLDIKGSKVHSGFYDIAYASTKILKKLLAKHKRVTITGHSLGGGIATLLCSILYTDGEDVRVYTFGSPPVGNDIFVENIKQLNHLRYVNRFDPVPMINKPVVGYIKKIVSQFNLSEPTTTNARNDKNLLSMILNTPYEFIHQGKKIVLTHNEHLAKSQEEPTMQQNLRAKLFERLKQPLNKYLTYKNKEKEQAEQESNPLKKILNSHKILNYIDNLR